MSLVPSSPRVQRRLKRLGIVLAVAGAVAAIMLLIPNPKGPNPAPAKNAPRAQVASRSTSVTRSERRAIDRTLDRFIPAALDRTSPQTAWALSGPGLRGGSTLEQWRHGTSPVPYYPASGRTFHGWRTIDAGPGYVDFNLLVHPRHGSRQSAWVFSGQMIKHGGRWLVNGLYTIATMAKPTKSGRHEVGPDDYAAAGASSSSSATGPQPNGPSALGKKGLLAVVGVISLVVLFPLAFFAFSMLRARRARRRYERPAARALPPLPRSAQRASEPAGGGGVGGQRH
jgi:hypothetical protein